MMDIYDQEIARLADSSREVVRESWIKAEPLFQYVGDDGGCGCLTMVRDGSCIAITRRLTQEIRRDERIPNGSLALFADWDSISPEERIDRLQPFAFWQRRLDVEIRGKAPAIEPTPHQLSSDVPALVCEV